MPALVRLLLSDLDESYDQQWVRRGEGHLTQLMRRDALQKAREHLITIGTISTAEDCFIRVRAQAIEMQNCRPPVDNPESHLQLRLRLFAFIQWLIDSPTEENRAKLEEIAVEMQCPEITAILVGEPIA